MGPHIGRIFANFTEYAKFPRYYYYIRLKFELCPGVRTQEPEPLPAGVGPGPIEN